MNCQQTVLLKVILYQCRHHCHHYCYLLLTWNHVNFGITSAFADLFPGQALCSQSDSLKGVQQLCEAPHATKAPDVGRRIPYVFGGKQCVVKYSSELRRGHFTWPLCVRMWSISCSFRVLLSWTCFILFCGLRYSDPTEAWSVFGRCLGQCWWSPTSPAMGRGGASILHECIASAWAWGSPNT